MRIIFGIYDWITENKFETGVIAVILFMVATLIFALSNEIKAARNGTIPGFNLRVVIFEGHKYIKHIDGGIAHAQSCECLQK